jgi:hypothetical protein
VADSRVAAIKYAMEKAAGAYRDAATNAEVLGDRPGEVIIYRKAAELAIARRDLVQEPVTAESLSAEVLDGFAQGTMTRAGLVALFKKAGAK